MTAARQLPFGAAAGELGRIVSARDWSATPLGPVGTWPGALRAAVALVLESPSPMLVWCGPDLVALYNDAFAAQVGDAHPAALGAPGEHGFAEAWPALGPALHRVLADGEAVAGTDRSLLLQRGSRPQETWWTFAHSPVRDEDGTVVGVFTTATETTGRVLAERRRATLAAIGELSAVRLDATGPGAGDGATDAVASAVLDALARDRRDVPFAALCRADGPDGTAPLRVAAAYGITGPLPTLPAADDAGADGGPVDAGSAVRQALRTGTRVVVGGLRERFPGTFPPPPHPPGPLPPDTAVVLPLGGSEGSTPHGALVLGASPYLPLDEDQLAFLDDVAAHAGAVLADVDRVAAIRRGATGGSGASGPTLYEDGERYRTLLSQAPVGIWVADRRGATTFANEQVAQLWGRPVGELTGSAWVEGVHPDDREATVAGWSAAVRDGSVWDTTYRISGRDGALRHVHATARPLRDAAGALTGFLGTTVDVTEERQAEQIRRDVAAEHAARAASEAAAARLRAMVQGLAAIVWEAQWRPDSRSLRFTFVSDRAEELLGHPAERWCDDAGFWPSIIHPEDRTEALATTSDRTESGLDHDISYRAVSIDGRVLWLHQVVHVVTGTDGAPITAQGLTVDITEQKRAERSAALLAETGRLVADGGSAEERLTHLADLVFRDLGDAAVVSMTGADGLLRQVAVACDDATTAGALRELGPTRLPTPLAEAFAPGQPVVVPVTDQLNRSTAHEGDADARIALHASNALVVPLRIGERVVGLLAFVNFGSSRYYHPSELDLAAELGRRASLMLAADRQRTRERHLQQVSGDLASAGSVAEAARLLVARLPGVLGADAVSVHLADPERGIRLVHADGHGPAHRETIAAPRPDDEVPVATAVRTGEPVWIRDRDEWAREWPGLVAAATADGQHAAATLPLTAAGRVVGTIGLAFRTERAFPRDEREFVLALVAQAAPAFERAATADERRLIAETLQTSLLPPTLPRLERLPLASRYLPAARGAQAGGDWYDVLPLDDGRVAIAVGDVVGQGARAAAIMGQLRSALSGYLLEGHEPEQALERLDRFAARVPGATGSTVACLVLDPETGGLRWARAGHPPPLVAGPDGCRPLEDAAGTVLGVRGRPAYTAGSAALRPGETIVLYTDGLVERRGELVDDGIDRLAALVARHHALAPAPLTDALLAGALAPGADAEEPDPADDVALIVARLAPAPLRLVLPAEAAVLRELRATLLAWTAAAGMDEDDVYDLQLAVGEAAANAVEHAYRGRAPGPMAVELERDADGGVRAHVRDEGAWRPVPEDKGYRGRGLELIRDVSSRMQLNHGPGGTEVLFTVPPSGGPPATVEPTPRPARPAPTGPAALRPGPGPDGRSVRVHGELDLAGVRCVRDELLQAAAAGHELTVDLRPTTYLASAGIALLVEADRTVRAAGGRLRLLVAPADVVRRALALSGVDDVLELHDADG
ncbi:SpoIIE family protein phosphatase [Pseudonocardia kunmingensis]|uniref:Anti-anti-sigma factor n=1 Tax=Pseudonocardia kunmingensis TaxID=630975 RepID=A0A543D1B4_9PSEU|nr:SpoIIE family protein phosphatase [Pseudonocardia kunmingensis]TQM03134.1 anti-anti-sigma factor [Pseudonocardia kunmingensis]